MVSDLMQGDVGVVATASEVARNITITIALIVALIGGYRGWYVWGRTHDRAIEDYEKRLAKQETDYQRLLGEKDAELRKKDAEIEWWQRLTLRATEVADWATRGYADGTLPPLGAGERGHPGMR